MTLAKPASAPYPRPQRRDHSVGRVLSRTAGLFVSIAGLVGLVAVIVLIALGVLAGTVALAVAAFL